LIYNIFKMENQLISVVFVTHNRKELLHQAISAIKQQSVPVEVIVMDDASTDDTAIMMRTDFPEVIYERSLVSQGPSYQRNEGAKKASSDIIIFLDDDTVAADKHMIRDTLRDFEQPTIGSIAIPFINVLQNNQVQNGAPDTKAVYLLHSFIGAAFAVKRDLFLSLGGFRPEYFYMGEEGDFCIRLLAAGYYIKAGTAVPAHHYQPPNRVSYRADYYGRRNDIFFLYLNSPRQYLVLTIASTIFKGLIWGIKQGRVKNMGEGIMAGLAAMFKGNYKNLKKPVTNSIFLKFHYLKKREPLPLSQLI
jgi:GT2 family glycosyltransferase